MPRNILLTTSSDHHNHLVGDGYRLLHLYSSYPGAYASIDNICQILLLCKQHNQRLMVSRSCEPNLLWTCPGDTPLLFIFDVLSQACERTSFPPQNITLISANIMVAQCAQEWFAQSAYTAMFNVVSHNHWLKSVCTVYPELDCYTSLQDTLRTRYFSCMNGSFRFHKWDVAQQMFLKGHFTDLAGKSYQSFIFNQISEDHDFYQSSPDLMGVLPRNLEHNMPIHPMGDENIPHYEASGTPQYETAITDSYFDVVVDFHAMEDLGDTLYTDMVADYPWWRENIMSEKLFKNFLFKRPFILIAEPGTLAYIRDELGFQTYDMIFDESYDQIQDRVARITSVVEQVTNIVKHRSLSELHAMIYSEKVQQAIEHNYRRLHELNSQSVLPYQ